MFSSTYKLFDFLVRDVTTTVTCHDSYYGAHSHAPSVNGISGVYTTPTATVSGAGTMSTFKPAVGEPLTKIKIPDTNVLPPTTGQQSPGQLTPV